MRARIGALVGTCVLLAGCGGKAPAPTTTAATGAQLALRAYFLRGNALTPVTVRVPRTQAVATAAMGALLAGPPPGYRTALPAGATLQSIAIAGGVASIRLSAG